MKKFNEIRENYKEELLESIPTDPPMVLVLRRKAIRMFAGGERVALYNNDKLGIEVSVPYTPGKKIDSKITSVSEEVIEEGALHKLHHIAKTKTSADVVFKNGASARIDPVVALRLIKLHHVLKPENKQKVETLVNGSPAGLQIVAAFAADNLKG